MITIESLIAIISLVLTSFGLGYTIGSSTKKYPPKPINLSGYLLLILLGKPSIGIAFSYLL